MSDDVDGDVDEGKFQVKNLNSKGMKKKENERWSLFSPLSCKIRNEIDITLLIWDILVLY